MRPAFAPRTAGALCALNCDKNGEEENTAPAPATRTDSTNFRREVWKCDGQSASRFGRSADNLSVCLRITRSHRRFLNRQPPSVARRKRRALAFRGALVAGLMKREFLTVRGQLPVAVTNVAIRRAALRSVERDVDRIAGFQAGSRPSGPR